MVGRDISPRISRAFSLLSLPLEDDIPCLRLSQPAMPAHLFLFMSWMLLLHELFLQDRALPAKFQRLLLLLIIFVFSSRRDAMCHATASGSFSPASQRC